MTNKTKYENNPWIPWNGGKCPVSSYTSVETQIRKRPDEFEISYAGTGKGNWDWHETCIADDDIVAYRIYQTSRELRLEEALDDILITIQCLQGETHCNINEDIIADSSYQKALKILREKALAESGAV